MVPWQHNALFGGDDDSEAEKEGGTDKKAFTQHDVRVQKQVQYAGKKLYK